MSIICLSDLSVGYRTGPDVLGHLSLEVQPGLTHLRGANGTGKSTLVETVAGTLSARSGRVQVYGRDPHAARPLRRVCRSQAGLYPTLTLREHLELLGRAGALREEVLDRCRAYGVDDWLDTPTEQLSTGNRQKAWIVLSTAADVALWLMDEPFNGLDTQGTEVLCAEIRQRVHAGRDVVLVAHHLPPALSPDDVQDLVGSAGVRRSGAGVEGSAP